MNRGGLYSVTLLGTLYLGPKPSPCQWQPIEPPACRNMVSVSACSIERAMLTPPPPMPSPLDTAWQEIRFAWLSCRSGLKKNPQLLGSQNPGVLTQFMELGGRVFGQGDMYARMPMEDQVLFRKQIGLLVDALQSALAQLPDAKNKDYKIRRKLIGNLLKLDKNLNLVSATVSLNSLRK